MRSVRWIGCVGGAMALLALNALGSLTPERRLTATSYNHAIPEFSPDGTEIICTRTDDSGVTQICKLYEGYIGGLKFWWALNLLFIGCCYGYWMN